MTGDADPRASARTAASDRTRAAIERALRTPLGRLAPRLVTIWVAAGADLLAGGLTFAAIFAFVPALLLTTGLISFVVVDPANRAAIASGIGDVFPPLAGVAAAAIDARLEGRINASLIAALGSIWGASTFYGALDEAFARVFQHTARRGMLVRIVRGMITVVLLLVLVIAMLLLTGIATQLTNIRILGLGRVFELVTVVVAPLLAVAVWIGAVYAAFRYLPSIRISRAAIMKPAVVIGTVLAAWTQAMAFLGDFFVGVAAELGPGLGVLAVLMWLWVSFNILIFGAAWVRVRADPATGAGAPVGAIGPSPTAASDPP